jgi:hypothetical protein
VSLDALGGALWLSAQTTSGQQDSLRQRVHRFLQAVTTQDVPSLAVEFFPSQGTFTFSRTVHTRDGDHVSAWRFSASDREQVIEHGPLTEAFTVNYEGQSAGFFVVEVQRPEPVKVSETVGG